MFSHMALGADDIEAARRFYDAALGALGVPPGVVDEWGRLIYMHNGGIYIITPPIDGAAATCGNGCTIGFAMSPEEADAWHQAGIDNGGIAIEDPPGVRNSPMGDLYLAYLRDPDGNKLCALHRMSA